jgi:ubiquinone/menaquinone biosynthesis C-methylase UbiE
MTTTAQVPAGGRPSPASADPSAPARPNPERIFDALSAHERTAALTAAIELDLFSAIGAGAATAGELAGRIGAAERGVRILADYLAVDGFLTKTDGRYGLVPEAAAFLDRRSPAYLGGMAGFLGTPRFLRRYERLADTVRRGGAAPDATEGALAPGDPMWVEFARGMAPMQARVAELTAEAVGGVTRALDIAAGHGLFGIAVARANPAARIVALDWENVLAVARENAEAAGVGDRVELLPGSAFEVDFGTGYDLVLVTNFLHHFDRPTCVELLRRVRAALGPGGRAAIVEFVPDESRVSPPIPAAFSLKMLATTPSGQAYTYAEHDAMCREAGFSSTELRGLGAAPQSLVVAGTS